MPDNSTNDTVLLYRDKINMFPTNIAAAMFGFKEATFIEAEEASRRSVKVNF